MKPRKLLTFFLLLLFVRTTLSYGQISNPEVTHIEFPGLDKVVINEIYQDSKGFLWIGSQSGLFRYDGYEYIDFLHSKSNTNTISNNNIVDIVEDRHGNLWIATQAGLNKYNPASGTFKRFVANKQNKHSISANTITSIDLDKSGKLWIGYPHDGISYMDTKTYRFVHYNEQTTGNKLPSDGIPEILIASDNKLWIIFYNFKLGYLDLNDSISLIPEKAQFKIFKHNDTSNGLDDKRLKNLYEDKSKNIWVLNADKNKNLYKYNKNKGIFEKQFTQIINFEVRNLITDKNNDIYISGKNDMIYIKNGQKKLHFRYEKNNPKTWNGQGSNVLFIDKSGVLWIGTIVGLDKYRTKKFICKKIYSDTDSNNITGIVQDKQGNTWLSMWDIGIYKMNVDGTSQLFKPGIGNHGLATTNVWRLFRDSRGLIWLGTYRAGLYTIENQNGNIQFEKCKKANFTPFKTDFSAISIIEDSQNTIWIGSWLEQSIMKYDRETNTLLKFWRDDPFKDSLSIGANIVSALYVDKNNTFWVGTNEGLAKQIKAGNENTLPQYKRYKIDPNKKNTISDNFIHCFCEDSNGNFWIGTKNGLNLMDREKEIFTVFTTRNGLSNNNIVGILEGNNGDLWIATSGGLTNYDRKNKTFISYTKDDGLPENGFGLNALYKSETGKLFFGGDKGFISFFPDSLPSNNITPKTAITDFRIFNKSLKPGVPLKDDRIILNKSISVTNEITLSYKDKIITIGFATLDFNNPKDNRYEYKLEGFKNEWTEVSADQRYATYTNLDPGQYVFSVKGTNNDGVWSEPVSLKITITPPWWQRWWFRISAVLFIMGSAIGFYFQRVNKLKRQKRILEQKVEERTSDLREANLVLEERQEEIVQQNEEIQQQADELYEQKQEIEKAYTNNKILGEFGQKLTATLNLEAINEMIYEYVCSLMDIKAFGIGIYEEKYEAIYFPAFIEDGEKLPKFSKSIHAENSITAYCFNNQETIFIKNADSEIDNYVSKDKRQISTSKNPESIIHIPLTVESNRIGILVANHFNKNAFTEYDLNKLQTLASYIAIALDNANAYKMIDIQNKNIKGSISYAQTIQQAILPPKSEVDSNFDNFIIYRPKDIVSGDFYWYVSFNGLQEEAKNKATSVHTAFFAVVDCTGHGVPGAFMSMIGNNLLNNIVIGQKIFNPVDILQKLHEGIRKRLNQETTKNDDGMDVCLIKIIYTNQSGNEQPATDNTGVKIVFSGAKRPLYHYSNGKLHRVKGAIKSIGGRNYNKKQTYKQEELVLQKGDMLYLTSDGFSDQHNKKRKKFGGKALQELFASVAEYDPTKQKNILETRLDDHQQKEEQRDDITIWGIRL